MVGRAYTASFAEIAVTAIQDALEVVAPSDGVVEILSARMSQSSDEGDAQAEMLPVTISRAATSGSGGASVTPRPHVVGHPAFGGTAERNNTTQAGTPTVIIADCFNVQAGWLYVPVPEERIWLPPSGIAVMTLNVAPADSLTMSGSITFAEYD